MGEKLMPLLQDFFYDCPAADWAILQEKNPPRQWQGNKILLRFFHWAPYLVDPFHPPYHSATWSVLDNSCTDSYQFSQQSSNSLSVMCISSILASYSVCKSAFIIHHYKILADIRPWIPWIHFDNLEFSFEYCVYNYYSELPPTWRVLLTMLTAVESDCRDLLYIWM